MSIGLKGDIDQVKDLVGYFDWTLNEECFQYQECDLLKPFSDAFHCHFILHMNRGCKPLRGQLACFKHEYALI